MTHLFDGSIGIRPESAGLSCKKQGAEKTRESTATRSKPEDARRREPLCHVATAVVRRAPVRAGAAAASRERRCHAQALSPHGGSDSATAPAIARSAKSMVGRLSIRIGGCEWQLIVIRGCNDCFRCSL